MYFTRELSLSFPVTLALLDLYSPKVLISYFKSGGFTGEIVTGGTYVKVSGDVNAYTRVLCPMLIFILMAPVGLIGTVVVNLPASKVREQIIIDYSHDLSFSIPWWPSSRARVCDWRRRRRQGNMAVQR